MGRVKFVLNLISFSSSLLCPIFYFYIYVSSSVLSYCSIKHDDDDDDVAVCDCCIECFHYPRRARSAIGVDTVFTLDVCLYVCMLAL